MKLFNKDTRIWFSVLSLFLFFTSCQFDKKVKVKSKGVETKIIFDKPDSIVIKGEGGLIFDDIRNDRILLHNSVSKDVVTYHLKKGTTTVFNKFGNNYQEYTSLLRSISFYNDTTVVIGGKKGISLFSIEGNFIKYFPVERSKKTYAPIMHPIFLTDSLFIFYESLQGDPSIKNFYKGDTIITVYHLNKGLIRRFAFFPEKESDYNDPEYYYLYPFLFNIQTIGDTLYLSSHNDLHIYKYQISNGNKLSVINLQLHYYHPLKFKFYPKKKYGINDYIKFIALNSTINRMYISDRFIFLGYNKALTDEEIKSYSSYDDIRKKQCIYITTVKGEKLIDAVLPERYGDFLFYRNDSLYFMARPTQESEDRNYTVIYKVKWNAE